MPNYLGIAWNISFNRHSLELEEIANFIEVGCPVKNEMHGNLPVVGM